jgi:4,5-DOPA dioxygenase extradiol
MDPAQLLANLPPGPRMPAFFVGHGSPMNAIEDNPFTRALAKMGRDLAEPPQAVLVVSAHWLTPGETLVHAGERPRTIHDFGGFPKELYEIQYPAPGAPEYAVATAGLLHNAKLTPEWGLDHGAWCVLRHMFPAAQLPVYQVSIDWSRPVAWHYSFAQHLKALRNKGVLIIGSGNVVHNLRASFPKILAGDARPYDWAVEFDRWVGEKIDHRDYSGLAAYQKSGAAGLQSVPSPDHFIPLLYTVGVAEERETITQTYEEVYYGGLSMRTFRVEAS